MALNWNVSKVKNADTVCWTNNKLNHATETLIWATMIVGLDSITEKNADEFFFRIRLREKLFGSLRRDWSGDEPVDVFVTIEEVKAHIGLGTNATNFTRARWMKHTLASYERDLKHSIRNAEAVA